MISCFHAIRRVLNPHAEEGRALINALRLPLNPSAVLTGLSGAPHCLYCPINDSEAARDISNPRSGHFNLPASCRQAMETDIVLGTSSSMPPEGRTSLTARDLERSLHRASTLMSDYHTILKNNSIDTPAAASTQLLRRQFKALVHEELSKCPSSTILIPSFTVAKTRAHVERREEYLDDLSHSNSSSQRLIHL